MKMWPRRGVTVTLGIASVCGGAWAQAPAGQEPPAPTAGKPSDPSDKYRSQVVRSNLRERAIEVLTTSTLLSDPQVRANAIEGLQAVPKRAEAAIRAGLGDENAGVRFSAVMSAAQLKLRTSLAFVEPLLADPDPRVRAGAIYALACAGQPVDPSPLGTMLMDPDARIRGEAARIVGLLGNPSAVPMLKSAAAEADRRNLQSGGASELQFQLERVFQLQVAEALARLGEPNGTDPLRAALYPTGREGLESAALAAQILGDMKEEKAVAQLVDLVEQATPETQKVTDPRQRVFVQPKEVRLAAATALAKIGYSDGLYVGQALLTDPDPSIRVQAAFLLAAGGRGTALPGLEALMGDSAAVVRVAGAASALRVLDRVDR